jgi:hypothetical protein
LEGKIKEEDKRTILHPCNWEDIVEEEDKFYIRAMNEMAY